MHADTYMMRKIHTANTRTCERNDTLCSTGAPCQPVQRLAAASIPLPVGHASESPSKVTQLAMLEQRAASRLMRTADKVGRTVHFDRNLLPSLQCNERVDAVPRNLATMLFLYILDIVRVDFSHHVALELRNRCTWLDESVAAGLA